MKLRVVNRGALSCALVAGLCVLSAAVHAQNTATYPTKAIRWVIANSAGGGLDTTARILGPVLGNALGQQLIYDNRGGAAGSVAAEIVAKAPPDGYTMLMGSVGNIAVNPHIYKGLAYAPLKDLAPVTFAVSGSNVLIVHPNVPAKSVQELVTLLRSKPGGLTYGSSGSGNAGHLAAELFQSMTKTKMTHVPYKGGAPAMTALLGGEVQLIFASPSTAQTQVQAGRVRALAVTTARRSLVLPDLPTLAETGLPGYETDNWYGVVVPSKTPRLIVERLNKELGHALSVPEIKAALLKHGLEARPGTPEDFGKYIRSEYEKWGRLIREAGISQG